MLIQYLLVEKIHNTFYSFFKNISYQASKGNLLEVRIKKTMYLSLSSFIKMVPINQITVQLIFRALILCGIAKIIT